MEKKLINIDDIMKLIDEGYSGDWVWDDEHLDALGVCRCKECIYLWHDANNDLFCAYQYGLKHPKETDYCPYAKRKENNNV